jgi:hypothetical protein
MFHRNHISTYRRRAAARCAAPFNLSGGASSATRLAGTFDDMAPELADRGIGPVTARMREDAAWALAPGIASLGLTSV